MSYTFLDLAEEVLEKTEMALNQEEIWEKAAELGLHSKCSTSGKTPWRSIGAQIYVNMRKPDSIFQKVSKKPVRFGLKRIAYDLSSIDRISAVPMNSEKFSERDLHPLLTTYVYGDMHFRCYAKTIYHETSKKKGKGINRWIHPDIVGVYFPFDDFKDSTINVLNSLCCSAIKLFSFEMKISINASNLREYFFQAVSNSSWANEGYLVALKYDNLTEMLDEMRRLNNAFGIGFIALNAENVEQSEIIFPAEYRENIDWEMVNRLVEDNPDFKTYIDNIYYSMQVQKVVNERDYDEIYESDKMSSYIKDNHINNYKMGCCECNVHLQQPIFLLSKQYTAQLFHTLRNHIGAGSFMLGPVAVAVQHADGAQSGFLCTDYVMPAVTDHNASAAVGYASQLKCIFNDLVFVGAGAVQLCAGKAAEIITQGKIVEDLLSKHSRL